MSSSNGLELEADLSHHHEAVGDLFEPVKDNTAWNDFKLPQDKIEQFQRDGYIANVKVLSEDQCDKILEDYKYFMDPDHIHPNMDLLYEYHRNQADDPNNVLMHALGHWRLTKHFHDLVFHPNVIVKASQLIHPGKDTKVRFWHDQLFAKPAKHGGVVAWHQDYSYWIRTTPMQHLTVHIALEDQTEDNGTLQYIPGSHKWTRNNGRPLPVLDFNFKDMEGIKTILTPEEKEQFKPVLSNLKKGEASFHHALCVHGSYGNRSNRSRRSAVLNYFADGTVSDSDEAQLKGFIIPKGQKMEGKIFPIVYDPAWTN